MTARIIYMDSIPAVRRVCLGAFASDVFERSVSFGLSLVPERIFGCFSREATHFPSRLTGGSVPE